MKQSRYKITSSSNLHFYQFASKGPKGDITKGVQFTLFQRNPIVYNLALGDWNEELQQLDDTVRSNNGDRGLIFATVGAIVMDFCNRNPHASVIAHGNTAAKNMLYRLEVAANLAEINNYFVVYGLYEGSWEAFKRNRKYTALLVQPINKL